MSFSLVLEEKGIEFSHGVCPHCYAAHLRPQIEALKRKRRGQGKTASAAQG